MNPWLRSRTRCDAYAAGLGPLGTGLRRREARQAKLVSRALRESPLYRRRRTAVGHVLTELVQVASLGKARPMHHLADWCTDRQIERASVDAIVSEPCRVADAFLRRCRMRAGSGTTGKPGIVVRDDQSLAAFDALGALCLRRGQTVTLPSASRTGASRHALAAATDGRFVSVAGSARQPRMATAAPWTPWRVPQLQTISVRQPLAELTAAPKAFASTVPITHHGGAAATHLAQRQAAPVAAEVGVGQSVRQRSAMSRQSLDHPR